MVETRLLHYFLTVARERNITNAAKALHITQPTLSRQMTLLEDELGVKLFSKESRPIRLTPEGMIFRRRAEEILTLVDRAEAEVSSCDGQVEGTVSIGCGELASVRLLTEWIADFRRQHPHVTFDVYTATADLIHQRMEDGLTDVGLLLEPVDTERYEYIRMPIKECWAVIMPSSAPQRAYVTAEELCGVPVILPSRQKVRGEVANWFGDSYGKLNVAAVSNLSTNAALLVRAGMGYALTIEGAMPFLDPSEVRMAPLYPRLISTSVLAWKREQPFSIAVKHFLSFIKCFQGMETE